MFNQKIGVIIISVFVVLLILLSFVLEGTPFDQKARAQDNAKSAKIQTLATVINNRAYDKKSLPTTLSELNLTTENIDPETNEPFTYRSISTTNYEICANFATKMTKEDKSNHYAQMYGGQNGPNPFIHEKGLVCFDYSAPEDYFKQTNTSVP